MLLLLLWLLVGCDGGTAAELLSVKPMEPCLDPAPELAEVARVRVGAKHACASDAAGDVVCWGDDSAGQVSDLPDDLVSTELGLGGDVSCAVDEPTTVRCWGDQTFAPLGPSDDTLNYDTLGVGADHGCALDTRATVPPTASCWGDDSDGQATPPAEFLGQIGVGVDFTCGLEANGEVHCWGSDADGVVSGAPTTAGHRDLAVGDRHACAIDIARDELICWGANDEGQLDGTGRSFRVLFAGLGITCGGDDVELITCWGGTPEQQPPPDVYQWLSLSGESRNGCGIKGDAELICWGEDPDITNFPGSGG